MGKYLSPVDAFRYRGQNRDALNNCNDAELEQEIKDLRAETESAVAYSNKLVRLAVGVTRSPKSKSEVFYTRALSKSFAVLDDKDRVRISDEGGREASSTSALFELCLNTLSGLTDDPSENTPSGFITYALFLAKRNSPWETELLKLYETRFKALSPEDKALAVEEALGDVAQLRADKNARKHFQGGRFPEFLQKKLKELKAPTNGQQGPLRPKNVEPPTDVGNKLTKDL